MTVGSAPHQLDGILQAVDAAIGGSVLGVSLREPCDRLRERLGPFTDHVVREIRSG